MLYALAIGLTLGCGSGRGPVRRPVSAVTPHSSTSPTPQEHTTNPAWDLRQSRWSGEAFKDPPSVVWTAKLAGPIVHPLRIVDDTVYAVAAGEVRAFSLDGVLRWSTQVNASGPVNAGDTGIHVPTVNGVMQVLDSETGMLKASYGGTSRIQTAPLNLDGTLAWVDHSGALNTTGGKDEAAIPGPVSDAASDGHRLVVGNNQGDVVAVSQGIVHWRTRVPGPVTIHPVIHGDVVYVPFGVSNGAPGGVVALDLGTSTLRWQTHLRFEPSTAPALGEHLVVTDKKGEMAALDLRHGGIRWRAPASAGFSTQPVVQSSAIYVGRFDGRLDRIDMTDGGAVWSVELGSAITGEMAATNGRVFLGTTDGRLIALESQ